MNCHIRNHAFEDRSYSTFISHFFSSRHYLLYILGGVLHSYTIRALVFLLWTWIFCIMDIHSLGHSSTMSFLNHAF